MNLKARLTQGSRSRLTGAGLTILCGLSLWYFPVGEVFERLSFDLPFAFNPPAACDDILIIRMDEQSYHELGIKWREQEFDRSRHAQLLRKLKQARSGLVVFDVFFPGAERDPGDSELASAIRAHGQVVLAGDSSDIARPGVLGDQAVKPWTNFLYAANTNWGLSGVVMGADMGVRQHYCDADLGPSLAWVAATLAGASVTKDPSNQGTERWVRYYGPNGTIPDISYFRALEQEPGYFRGKTVFIGGKPNTRFPGALVDHFRTPYTRFKHGQQMQGVDIQATMFLNLVRGDWLQRMSWGKECSLLFLAGLFLGYSLARVRPMLAGALGALAFCLVPLAAIFLEWKTHVWFSWMIIAAGQVPCAFVWSVLTYTTTLAHDKEVLELKLESSLSSSQKQPRAVATPDGTRLAPLVPDHKLLRSIGHGAYGEVWLAVNTIGLPHAVKIVDQTHFNTDEPYAREFKGMERYMPISLKHPGLVHILHVGRNDEAGYFYYVMEIGDDEVTGNKILTETYSARNLARDLRKRGRLPVAECVSLGLALTDALEFLHQQQLIHRDIKPSNIIFVNGVPKLADIGLVTSLASEGRSLTYVGTEGFIAPEGPKSPASDVYSMGKVLYEAATGLDRMEFPRLPDFQEVGPETVHFIRLNAIIVQACQDNLQDRYKSAAELRAHLLELQRHLG